MPKAKTQLPARPAQVDQGAEAVAARNGMRAARLAPDAPQYRRVPGSWRDPPSWEAFRYDRALFAPMSKAEMEDEGWP
jgi:hypothetical protein